MKANSILVTGTDLVGKTTLINQLIPYLTNCGLKTISNKHDLYKTDVMTCIQTLFADSPDSLLQINSLFFVSFLLDSIKFKPEPGVILVQDSYACRTIAFSHAYKLTPITELFEAFRHQFYSFDVTIHLMANIEVKTRRLSAMTNPNRQDHLVLTAPDKLLLMDQCMNSLIKSQKHYLQLDTSELTITQVFDQVVAYLNPFL